MHINITRILTIKFKLPALQCYGMVRLQIPIVNNPPKTLNYASNFLSITQQCLSLLKRCSSMKHVSQIHARIQIYGIHKNGFLTSELVRFCALSPSGNLSYARYLLYHSDNSKSASWNFLIRGYASSNSPREAIQVFLAMRGQAIRPNNLTFPFLFKACATLSELERGRQIQAIVFKYGLDCDVYVQNSMIHFYGSCKKIVDARQVFDAMSFRTVVSWSSVISACAENSRFEDSFTLFVKMRDLGFQPDEATMVILLSACAELGNLSFGRWVHSQVIERGLVVNVQLGSALVDMYAKCGAIHYAKLVFDRLLDKNVWTWSAMILGLAQHGFAKEALQLFTKMKQSSVLPNYVTFLGALCACSHAGLVDDAYKFFHDMKYVHGIKPKMTHYGAMVDTLGRAGRLKEAYAFIINMPIEPDPVMWRTLLSACNIHDVNDYQGVNDAVRKRLLKLEPKRSANLVMFAKMYAEVGMWEKSANVRRNVKKKLAGESCVDLGGSIHRFLSRVDSRVYDEGIYTLLDGLNLHMKMGNQNLQVT